MTQRPFSVVLVDLDDTLYPQSQWLDGAWKRVAEVARRRGLPGPLLEANLRRIAAEGSDRGHIIDRALSAIGASGFNVVPLVTAFWSHRPAKLTPYPGVRAAMGQLRSERNVIVVTDGKPAIQRHKVSALGLDDLVDAIVVADDVGRQTRKPSPEPLKRALGMTNVEPCAAVMIGDRPDKDVLAAQRAGVTSIRVRTGEYRDSADIPMAWMIVDSFAEAASVAIAGGAAGLA